MTPKMAAKGVDKLMKIHGRAKLQPLSKETRELIEKRTIKNVAIIGAGASVEAGAPTLQGFFDKVQELIGEGRFTNEEQETFRQVLQKRKEWLPGSNVEDFLSYLDFQIGFGVIVPPRTGRNIMRRIFNRQQPNLIYTGARTSTVAGQSVQEFQRVRRDTTLLISRTLDECLTNTTPTQVEPFKLLLKQFDVIISFNWDILVEYAYKKMTQRMFNNHQLGFTDTLSCPALIKMHGSFSWGRCTNCRSLSMHLDKIEHKIISDQIRCNECNGPLESVSILPTLEKFKALTRQDDQISDDHELDQRIRENNDTRIPLNFQIPPYRVMWYNAGWALSEAKNISVFGFSLAEGDIHTRLFLKMCATKNYQVNGDRLRVKVVNPSARAPSDCGNAEERRRSEILKERYKRVFPENCIEFIPSRFGEYWENKKKKKKALS